VMHWVLGGCMLVVALSVVVMGYVWSWRGQRRQMVLMMMRVGPGHVSIGCVGCALDKRK